MAKVSTHLSIDPELKKAGQELYSDLGMDLSTAFTVFLKQSLRVQGIPFEVTRDTSDESASEIIREYMDIKTHPEKYKRYTSFKDAMEDVLN